MCLKGTYVFVSHFTLNKLLTKSHVKQSINKYLAVNENIRTDKNNKQAKTKIKFCKTMTKYNISRKKNLLRIKS